jgi:hypothetical protein
MRLSKSFFIVDSTLLQPLQGLREIPFRYRHKAVISIYYHYILTAIKSQSFFAFLQVFYREIAKYKKQGHSPQGKCPCAGYD